MNITKIINYKAMYLGYCLMKGNDSENEFIFLNFFFK